MPLKKDEKTKKEDFASTPSDEGRSESRIYWAKAKGYQIANFEPEKKQGGSIIKPERPLRFTDHIKMTSDKKEIAFIESSDAFISGAVVRVKTLEEAAALTSKQRAMRQIREITSTFEETAPVGQHRNM